MLQIVRDVLRCVQVLLSKYLTKEEIAERATQVRLGSTSRCQAL